jgi:hypothetical protein
MGGKVRAAPHSLRERYPTPLAAPDAPPREAAAPEVPGRRLRAAAALGAAAPLVAWLAILSGVPLLLTSGDDAPGSSDRGWHLFARIGAWGFGLAVGLATRGWFPLGLVVACLAGGVVTSAALLVLWLFGGFYPGAGGSLAVALRWAWFLFWELARLAILPAAAGAGIAWTVAWASRAARAARRRS